MMEPAERTALDELSQLFQRAADAYTTLAKVMDDLAQSTRRLKTLVRRARVRRLLGYDDDMSAPEWVRRVHERHVEEFGSGNGQG